MLVQFSSLVVDGPVELYRLFPAYCVDVRTLLDRPPDESVAVLVAASVTGMEEPSEIGLDVFSEFIRNLYWNID